MTKIRVIRFAFKLEVMIGPQPSGLFIRGISNRIGPRDKQQIDKDTFLLMRAVTINSEVWSLPCMTCLCFCWPEAPEKENRKHKFKNVRQKGPGITAVPSAPPLSSQVERPPDRYATKSENGSQCGQNSSSTQVK